MPLSPALLLTLASLLVTVLTIEASVYGQPTPATRESVPTLTEVQRRGIQYLTEQVPRWVPENRCRSCHNNGDGARALFYAARIGVVEAAQASQDTLTWLTEPDQWQHNGPPGEFNDLQLARIQFAVALAAAVDTKQLSNRRPLQQAAALLARHQETDGSWHFAGADEIGSPVTYGRPLATTLALQVLRTAQQPEWVPAIQKAESWLLNHQPRSVLNAASLLWGLANHPSPQAAKQRTICLELIRKGEAPHGGWGPYVTSAPEPFDSAIVLLALHASRPDGWKTLTQRGREFLQRTQRPDGSWPETTRKATYESYAQRISTSAWALQALLE